MTERYPLYESEPQRDPAEVETTEVILRLRLNTGTYGSAEDIVEDIAESLEWLYYDHDGILGGTWEIGRTFVPDPIPGQTCYVCGGTGEIDLDGGIFSPTVACGHCDGTGVEPDDPDDLDGHWGDSDREPWDEHCLDDLA